MILTGKMITNSVTNGLITIEPFDRNSINPNSYNYRLGSVLYEIDERCIDPYKPSKYKKVILNSEGYELKPGKIYLGSTVETIGSDDYVTSLIGRSSVGRLGIFVQITADLGNLGSVHRWTLEIYVVQKIVVYPGMKIGQVSFWKPSGASTHKYTGKYGLDMKPYASKLHEELKK